MKHRYETDCPGDVEMVPVDMMLWMRGGKGMNGQKRPKTLIQGKLQGRFQVHYLLATSTYLLGTAHV